MSNEELYKHIKEKKAQKIRKIKVGLVLRRSGGEWNGLLSNISTSGSSVQF